MTDLCKAQAALVLSCIVVVGFGIYVVYVSKTHADEDNYDKGLISVVPQR
jgi:hypothetical protein